MSVDPSINTAIGENEGSVKLWTWVLLTATPTGTGVSLPEWADANWAIGNVTGDSFGGATCTLQGSNTDVDGEYVSLSNAAGGAAATATAAKAIATIENLRYLRPKLTTAGAAATVTVTVLMRRQNPMRT